jgi:hypothetical protein
MLQRRPPSEPGDGTPAFTFPVDAMLFVGVSMPAILINVQTDSGGRQSLRL